MSSLLRVGNTYDTISGYSVLLLDKEYAKHDIVIFKGMLNVEGHEIYAYFTDNGCCLVCDILFLNASGIADIEDLDILLNEKQIEDAYNELPQVKEQTREELVDIVDEALTEFKNEIDEVRESTQDETSYEEEFINFLNDTSYQTILMLRESVSLIHAEAMSNVHNHELWRTYEMMADQLRKWNLNK